MKHYQVIQRDDGKWAVIRESANRAASVHPTQSDAIATARELIAKRSDAVLTRPTHSATATNRVYETPAIYASAPPVATLAERIGARIKRGRTMRGLSLRDLADQLDQCVSHTTLQKIETGQISPDSRVLSALARVLKLRPDYFFQSDRLQIQGIEYRKLTKLGRKQQEQLEEQAIEFFERYCEIESILDLTMPELPHYDLSGCPAEDIGEAVEEAAISLRKEWNLGMNPIPDVHLMLENNGIKVKMLAETEGFDGFSTRLRAGDRLMGTMAVAKHGDLPRLRLTALHELAHLVLELPSGLEHKTKEKLCHRFAGAFLIPKPSFERTFGQNRTKIASIELKAIKAEWGISCAATMARAKDLGLITDGRYKSFCFLYRKWNWHKGEPGHWSGAESSNRFEPLVLRALAQERISTSKAAGLLNVPLPELGAKFNLID